VIIRTSEPESRVREATLGPLVLDQDLHLRAPRERLGKPIAACQARRGL